MKECSGDEFCFVCAVLSATPLSLTGHWVPISSPLLSSPCFFPAFLPSFLSLIFLPFHYPLSRSFLWAIRDHQDPPNNTQHNTTQHNTRQDRYNPTQNIEKEGSKAWEESERRQTKINRMVPHVMYCSEQMKEYTSHSLVVHVWFVSWGVSFRWISLALSLSLSLSPSPLTLIYGGFPLIPNAICRSVMVHETCLAGKPIHNTIQYNAM